MSSSSSLIQQGIEAYRAGDRDGAVRLLTQAVQDDPQSEDGWLYLGAALSDPARQRQAFQRVLAINPNNEKAKNAIARLDAAAGGRSAGQSASDAASKFGKQAGAAMGAAGTKMNDTLSGKQAMKLPVQVAGAPESITVPYMIDLARTRIQQGIQIYTKQDFEQIVTAGQSATQWDSVFIAGVGAVAVGLATFLGREIGWVFGGFFGGFGGLITPIFAGIIAIVAYAAGFAGAVYASRWYLQNQNINVSLPQHSMYYAMVWLPLTLIAALMLFLSDAVGLLILCLFPIFIIVGIVLDIYGILLLKGAFDRLYGTENNRGLITAVIAIVGGAVARGVVSSILGAIFRLSVGGAWF
ncbi:MAG TPA: hypothetical protein VKQ72_13930 [Aggregatilineales bacterium]|nr:hypothetical protein [Aggregatilineales bacterium]